MDRGPSVARPVARWSSSETEAAPDGDVASPCGLPGSCKDQAPSECGLDVGSDRSSDTEPVFDGVPEVSIHLGLVRLKSSFREPREDAQAPRCFDLSRAAGFDRGM